MNLPEGCGIAKGPDGTIVLTGGREAVAQMWINEMKGKLINVQTGSLGHFGCTPGHTSMMPVHEYLTVVELTPFNGGCDNLGVYWNCAEYGSTHVRSWHEVHKDLGNVMIDTSARCD